MDAFEFITGGDAKEILAVLDRAQCKACGGTGERNDAEAGDMFHNTWVCQTCQGKGWNRQAVREIIAAVHPGGPPMTTTDTSAESVDRLAKDHETVAANHELYVMGHPHHIKTAATLRQLLSELREAREELALQKLADMGQAADQLSAARDAGFAEGIEAAKAKILEIADSRDDCKIWNDERPYVCEETTYREISDLTQPKENSNG